MPGEKKKRANRRERPTIEPIPAPNAEHSKFARALGSSDPLTRNKAVEALTKWLTLRKNIKEAELIRIWKGLFYCYWHSDLVPVQTELAEKLAGILEDLSAKTGYLYFTVFLTTMRREWFGIDRLRLDKFLMLIRKFIYSLLVALRKDEWDPMRCSQYSTYLLDHVLMPKDTYLSAGVAYHISDIFIEELFRVVGPSDTIPHPVFDVLLSPFCSALATTSQPPLLARIKEGVFVSLLDKLRDPEESIPLEDKTLQDLATKLFELGAEPITPARNREVLYDVSSTLEKAMKKRARREAATAAVPQGAATSTKLQSSQQSPEAPVSSDKQMANGKKNVTGKDSSALVAKKKRKREKAELLAKMEAIANDMSAMDGTVEQSDTQVDVNVQEPISASFESPAAGDDAIKNKKKNKKKKAKQPNGTASTLSLPQNGTSLMDVSGQEQGQGVGGCDTSVGHSSDGHPAVLSDMEASAHQLHEKRNKKKKQQKLQKDKGMEGHKGSELHKITNGVKSVRWDLDHNLYLSSGEPVPPMDVRTPPRARPKGSALKVTPRTRQPTRAAKLNGTKKSSALKKARAMWIGVSSAGY